MKIKCQPEDFYVEELINLRLKPRGRYSIYRLEKRGWNTLDVIRELQRRWGWKNVSRAGLKDRYSLSVQYVSIPGTGPKRINADNFSLSLIGMADEPVSRKVLTGNRFKIIVRNIGDEEKSMVMQAVKEVRQFGVPNYYDEQRFGSARHQQGFIARKLIDGHYNGALKLFLATPGQGDDSRSKKRKKLLAENWGNWQRCLELASFEGQPVFRYLVDHPKDFLGAVKTIPRTMLELFINAYQGWLWNKVVAVLLEELGCAHLAIDYGFGRLVFYDTLSSEQASYLGRLVIPVPGPNAEFKSERVARITQEVLASEGLEFKDLKLKFRMKGLFFKPYERATIVKPQGLQVGEFQSDDLYPGKNKLRIGFTLPPGSYATILLKRIFLGKN